MRTSGVFGGITKSGWLKLTGLRSKDFRRSPIKSTIPKPTLLNIRTLKKPLLNYLEYACARILCTINLVEAYAKLNSQPSNGMVDFADMAYTFEGLLDCYYMMHSEYLYGEVLPELEFVMYDVNNMIMNEFEYPPFDPVALEVLPASEESCVGLVLSQSSRISQPLPKLQCCTYFSGEHVGQIKPNHTGTRHRACQATAIVRDVLSHGLRDIRFYPAMDNHHCRQCMSYNLCRGCGSNISWL
jgi:hypothetical protein